jgi:hypothetical protein
MDHNINSNINDEYSDSDSDSNDEHSDSELIYDGEENSNTKLNLVTCEIYNQYIHGKSNILSSEFLVLSRYKYFNNEEINYEINMIKSRNQDLTKKETTHSSIRNYEQISKKNLVPEIVICNLTADNELICVKKTYLLKLIQRRWKNIFKQKQDLLTKQKAISSLKYREIHGTWPRGLNSIPGLKGMINFLKR